MANNQKNNFHKSGDQQTSQNEGQNQNESFNVTNQGQNLGGGKEKAGGQKIGQFADDDNFEIQTDQTITQAAPGQTTTATDQGSSNA